MEELLFRAAAGNQRVQTERDRPYQNNYFVIVCVCVGGGKDLLCRCVYKRPRGKDLKCVFNHSVRKCQAAHMCMGVHDKYSHVSQLTGELSP